MFSPFVHRLHAWCGDAGGHAVHRLTAAVQPASLIHALPALGDVLHVSMQSGDAAVDDMPRGLLAEQWQLASLLQVRWLMQASMITVDGPREWIDCLDRHGHICSRLHLLPDTDYLAWDRLIAIGTPIQLAHAQPWFLRERPACARLLRFRQRRLAGLLMLGADGAGRLSSLGRVLADRIARDEAVALQS